jgi:hypothetical protein
MSEEQSYYLGGAPFVNVSFQLLAQCGGEVGFLNKLGYPMACRYGVAVYRMPRPVKPVSEDHHKLGAREVLLGCLKQGVRSVCKDSRVFTYSKRGFKERALKHADQPSLETLDQMSDVTDPCLCFFKELGGSSASFPAKRYATDAVPKRAGGEDITVSEESYFSILCRGTSMQHLIPGVTTPMVYIGLARTFSDAHSEPLGFASINQNHCKEAAGPIMWLGIPCREYLRLLLKLKESGNLEEYLGKSLMLSASILDEWHIYYCTALQQPGDTVVTAGVHEVIALP